MSRPNLPLWLVCLPLVVVPSVAAQSLGLIPKTIRFQGSQVYTTSDLLPVIGLKPGQTYSSDYLNQGAKKLMATGLFDGVSFQFNGVDLVYVVSDSANLYPVQIDNLPLQSPAEVNAELRNRVPLYRGKVPSEGGMLESVRSALEAMLTSEGVAAHVSPVPSGEANAKATGMEFRMDSPTVLVGDVTLEGASADMMPKLASLLRAKNRTYSWTKTPADLAGEVAAVYDANGYPRAAIRADRNGHPVIANQAVRVPFTIHIEEGRKYRLGTVTVDSTLPVAGADLDKLTGPRSRYQPENAYANAVKSAVVVELHAQGYLDCAVEDHPQVDEANGVVNYTVTAKPGPVYHLGLLKFQNVGENLRQLLMRDWQMMPGDPFNDGYVSNFFWSIQKNDPALQRSLAGVKASYDVKADPQTHDVNVVIRLERQ